ncbi:HesA/MoeB/ThiF family protein [Mucilaginibacter myungsuensis]|uniref:Molybdopterin-synthase adenylyltransferase n=1 Tax=Mucilaginibacter myungsuensis TaxID=649104 RepID=A0A929PWP0_9SPHI|nr:HesA/MoeB/ThiF family protein [Mucilaginibacter myungsuensis]MBE9661550.1 HesA/MoeB/ThiF family protein [Mucilaginibacter myungsuensis]MDN3597693.1 HesA/MoeB/ThiF family protein [Mucilaginibacter myungsuensis]
MDTSRYSCQIALPGFGEQAQERLAQAKVVVVGMGGLGCPVAQYLAASGIGTLGIVDEDIVSLSNLHRQILYTPNDVGLKKVIVAAAKLQAQNPGIAVVAHPMHVSAENVMELYTGYDIIVDCTDNFDTRYLLNDAAVLSGKPIVYGAIYQFEGQVALWNALNTDGTRSPNYRDLFPAVDATQVPNCTDGGVIPTLAGMIGCMQANEVIKLITNTGEPLAGKVLTLDAQTMQSRVIKIGRVTNANITALPKTDVPEVLTVEQVRTGLSSGDMELIDIRSSAEHDDHNIGGKHIPAYKLERELANADPAKTLVLYCTIGKRSANAVKQLKLVYPNLNIASLAGGVKAWGYNVQ